MKIGKLLENIKYTLLVGEQDQDIIELNLNSKEVVEGGLFVATKGTKVDSHLFIDNAIKKGAIAVLCEDIPSNVKNHVAYVQVENTRKTIGLIAANFYDQPSRKLNLVGVTGTNGKTTCVSLMYQLYKALGYSPSLISTIGINVLDKYVPTNHTTPDVIVINKILSEIVEQGGDYCFMEVSSHALDMGRVEGLNFAGVVFTNITHDHLDYHKTFKNYIYAKKRLFDHLSEDSFAIVNLEDKNARIMIQNCSASTYTYALKGSSDFKAKIIEQGFEGTLITIDQVELWTRLVGDYNISNLLAVYATSILLGEDKEALILAISKLIPVEGRFDIVRSKLDKIGIVDYAHTPDALYKLLSQVNKIKQDYQNIITIVGCGGDRDVTKRPKMAAIAAENSDKVVLTSDNPRGEDPENIINQMKSGLKALDTGKVLAIVNRREAIKTAVMLAADKDIILLVGKGHEKYQLIGEEAVAFDDKNELEIALN